MSVRRAPPTTPTPADRLRTVLRIGMMANPSENRAELVEEYIMDNIRQFELSTVLPIPGRRVLERDSGRLGTVVKGGKMLGGGAIWYPAVVYDDEPGRASTKHDEHHFVVLKKDAILEPRPWERARRA